MRVAMHVEKWHWPRRDFEPGMLRLVEWFPSRAAITRFDLRTSSVITSDATKSLVWSLSALTSLSLTGKKVTPSVLKAAGADGKLAGLEELTLASDGDAIKGNNHQMRHEVRTLISRAPLLKTLKVPPSFLHAVRTGAKLARKGGRSLITSLWLLGLHGGTAWTDMRIMGEHFPELTSLSIDELVPGIMSFFMAPMQPLPRLHTLRINKISFTNPRVNNNSHVRE